MWRREWISYQDQLPCMDGLYMEVNYESIRMGNDGAGVIVIKVPFAMVFQSAAN